ncbi:putative PurR-regulated permease PerM [Tahibacter aquaticus]|uniref:Putative PurR-regulated permease PerM n=1 Tax=Tahibacter aquaticus TaxID=520092 RepID=A0A4R6YRS1_9GAMM|nr:AI-2E family transporter [Tahibacter aquaticus]TDR40742.1 putative PurR-regulated permease PerM [Tahibacter aquaticus]
MNEPRWWRMRWHWVEPQAGETTAALDEEARLGANHQQRQIASLRLTLVWLSLLATVTVMYLAKALLVPVLLAVFLALSLNPLVASLSRRWLPRALIAFLVMFAGTAVVALVAVAVVEPARHWIERAPEAARLLTPRMRAVTQQIEAAGRATRSMMGTRNASPDAEPPVLIDIWGTVAAAPRLVVALFSVFLLIYFFLVYGEALLRRGVSLTSSQASRRNAVDIVRVMQHEISRYLFTTTAINTLVGIGATAIAFGAGIPDPLLWGVIALLLNFIPYFGPLCMTLLFAVLGLLSFAKLGPALTPAGLFASLVIVEGQFLTPLVLGRRLQINPLMILLWLMLLGWLWGAIGIVIAVPLLVALKIVAQRVEGWDWFARLVG